MAGPSLKLGEAFVELVAKGEAASLRRDMQREADAAARGVTAKIGVDVDRGRLRDARGRFVAAGRDAGEGFNEGMSRAIGGAKTANSFNGALKQLGGGLAFLNFGSPALGAAAFGAAAFGATGSVMSLASSIGIASGSALAFIPAAFGAAAAAGTIYLGFSRVGGALKAYKTQQDQASVASTKAAKVETNNAAAIRSAQEQLADAIKQRGRVQRDVAEQVHDAESRLTDTQDRAKEAQLDLNEARKEAIKNLKELKQAASDAGTDEEMARVRLERAKLRVQQTTNDPKFSPQEQLEAQADLLDAERDYKNAQQKTIDTAKEAQEAQKKGVEGDKGVVDAKKKLIDANKDVKEAERDLATTRERAGEQQEDAQIAVARAAQGLKDAQKKTNEATNAGTAASIKYKDALADLTPEGRAFVKQLIVMQKLIDKLKDTAERNMLPGLTDGLKSAATLFPIVDGAVAKFARTIGDTGRDLGKYIETPIFKKQFKSILDDNADAFDTLGDAAVPIARIITNVADAASPLVPRFADVFTNSVKLFDAWIQGKKDSGDLDKFFKRSGDELGHIWDVLKDIDYQKLANVVASTIQLTGGLMAFKFAANHPWFAVMGLLAKKYPEETAAILDKAAQAVGGAIKWVSDHPAAAGTLLAILGAYQGLSKIGSIKLPDLFGKIPGLKGLTERGSIGNPMYVMVLNEGFGATDGGGNLIGADGKQKVGKDGKPVKGGGKGGIKGGGALGILGAVTGIDIFFNALGSSLSEELKGLFWDEAPYNPKSKTHKDWLKWQHWFAITFPNSLNVGVGKGGWSGLVGNVERWFSHTLPDSLNLGEGTGWSGLKSNFGNWWGHTLPGALSPGTSPGWTGLKNDTAHWFGHTLPDAINLGDSSGWTGLKNDIGGWFGQTLPNAVSPGGGGGWSGAGKRWKEKFKGLLGVNSIQGLWDGINSKTGDSNRKSNNWTSNFTSLWKGRFGIGKGGGSTVFSSIGSNLISGAWGGITSKWNGIKKGSLAWIDANIKNPLSSKFGSIGDAMKKALSDKFSSVKNAIIGPANGMIGILNSLIDKVNWPIPNQWDIPKIGLIPVPKKATGGPISGPGTGTSDQVPILASNGEWVLRANAVNALSRKFGSNFLHTLNHADKYDISGDPSAIGVRRYANGGLIEKTQDFIRGVDPLPYVWAAVGPNAYDCSGLVGEVWNRLTGHRSYQRRFTTHNVANNFGFVPGHGLFTIGLNDHHVVGNLAGLAFEAASTRSGIKVGANARSVNTMPQQFYLPQLGDGFVDGGGGKGGDGSQGFFGRQAAKIFDKVVGGFRKDINGFSDRMGGLPGAALKGVGNGGLDGIRKALTSFDSGGWLEPGITPVINGTRKPEAVFTQDQMSKMGGATYNISQVHIHPANSQQFNSMNDIFGSFPGVVKANSAGATR